MDGTLYDIPSITLYPASKIETEAPEDQSLWGFSHPSTYPLL